MLLLYEVTYKALSEMDEPKSKNISVNTHAAVLKKNQV